MLHPQAFPWEAVLAVFFLLLFYMVVRRVRNRRVFARVAADADLPDLKSNQRITGKLTRIYRDPRQGVWLADLTHGSLEITFCATDHEQFADRYKRQVGNRVEAALFALSTLAPGGVDALPEPARSVVGADVDPASMAMIRTGLYPNDHVVIGRVVDDRDDSWGELPITVYTVETSGRSGERLLIDLAVRADPTQDRFKAGSLVHGSARLYGYLA